MKKIISMILVCTMFLTTVNISFAAEVEQGDITSYGASAANDVTKLREVSYDIEEQAGITTIKEPDTPDIITNREDLARGSNNTAEAMVDVEKTRSAIPAITSTDFVFNANLLTSFNTIIAPKIGNGANEPKFSYNSFLEENISDYSGELTLNFEDLVLDGRNGLDLRIGRTYQSVASSVSGNASLMVLPNSNGYLVNKLVNDYSTYQIDRYNLGVGWSFSFPSVQVETEYIPQEVVDTYYYDEKTELYYHSGNGEVYQVQFTSDTTDSNLKGYYNKDIQFNRNDKSYSNGQVTSYYSLTDADKTKQYFAEDGRLIGIVDRFGNTIKFEHELHSITNRVPQGNFAYREIEIDGDEFDEDMWFTSTDDRGTYDAVQLEDTDIGSGDGYVMYFRRNNDYGDTYILSQPIQIKPLTYYDFGMRFKSQYGDDIKIEIIGYDTAYNIKDSETIWIRDYDTENWVDFTDQFAMSSAIRYVQIKITPENAKYMYIDTVSLDEPKPLISKITDSVERTVTFNYTGGIDSLNEAGAVTLTVSSPDSSSSRVLTYNKTKIEYTMAYQDHAEQRLYWYLANSDTEGEDGVKVYYTYDGGSSIDSTGNQTLMPLYMRYDTKTQSSNDKPHNKPVLNSIHYKESSQIQYEYSQGISAHPTHIRMGLDFYRKSWIEKIDAAITHTGVAVVKGVSGQGKSTLCYRYLIDNFSEEFVFCVRSITSESQAQNLVTALLALNKHCENLVVYIDVTPGEYNWAFLLQELQTRGLAVPVLISIRDEDYNATRISGKAILYDIIELQLTKEEAKTIYDNFTAGNPHSQHRSFDEAWINFGGNGPLIEFVYLLTNNQTLTQRLSEQINTLLQERVPDSWLDLLNIVCFTGRLGCSVEFEHVKNEISCDSMFSAVQRLCDEYLIRVIDDGNRIEVLHPVRAKIIYDILCKLIGDNSDKMVISAIKCVEPTNSKVILLDYFTNHKYDFNEIEKIAKLTFSDWISYGNVLKVMLWLDVKRYVESNVGCISELIKKRGKGWLCFIPLDFTGLDRPNEIIAESMLLGLPNINRDSMIQAIEETKASLTSLMLDYKVADCFLTNSNIPSSIPNTDEGWTLFGYSLFWCSKREIKINLNYEIEQILNEMKRGDIQSRADAIRGLSEYPELLEYYNIAEDTLIERLIKEFQVIYFHKNNDEVCCKFIPPFVKESSEQNMEIEKNQNQYWRIKMLDILQQIYPDKEYIDIELIGVNVVEDLGIKPLDYKLRIEKKNRHIQWMSDINAWVKTRIDFDLRPDSWNEYVAKIDELRVDANDLVLDTIKCIDDLYKKKTLNKGRWDKVVSKMQVFSRHVFAENRLPKSAVDPYCLHTESTKKLPFGEEYPLLQLLSLEKYKKFRKELSETYTSLENFYNQFQEVLVVRVKNESIDTVKNPRLAMYNLFTAAKHLLDFQYEYRILFSSYSTLMDNFDTEEIQNILILMNVWRTVLDNPIKGYPIAYDAKQKFRKGNDYFEKTISNISVISDFKVHSTETQIYILDEFDLLNDSTLEENYAKTVLLLREAFSNALIFDSNRWYVETQQTELVYVPLFKGVAMGSAFSIPMYRLLDMDESKLKESILPCEIDDTLIYNFLNLPAERLLLWKDVLANVAGVKVILKQYSEVYFSTKNELCTCGFEAYKNALLAEIDTMVHKGEKNKLFVEELLEKADDENKEYLEVVALLLDSIAEIRDKVANEEDVSNEIDIIEKVVGAMVILQPYVAEIE